MLSHHRMQYGVLLRALRTRPRIKGEGRATLTVVDPKSSTPLDSVTDSQQRASVSETNRIEAFSDGVFAIAITLLILQISVPAELREGVTLRRALLSLWPSYLAFITSFFTIGVMWINHHRLFSLIQRSDHVLLVLNMLLLLGVTFVPFPTAVLAEHLQDEHGLAAGMFYAGTFFFIALTFNVLWRYSTKQGRLLGSDTDFVTVRAITKQYAFGPLFYIALFLVANFSPTASLVGSFLLGIFFALPPKKVAAIRQEK